MDHKKLVPMTWQNGDLLHTRQDQQRWPDEVRIKDTKGRVGTIGRSTMNSYTIWWDDSFEHDVKGWAWAHDNYIELEE